MSRRLPLPVVNGTNDDDDASIHAHQRIGPSRPLRRPESRFNALFKQFLNGDLQTTVELETLQELLQAPSSPEEEEEEEEDLEFEELVELPQSVTTREESSEDTLYDIPNKRFTAEESRLESVENSRRGYSEDLSTRIYQDVEQSSEQDLTTSKIESSNTKSKFPRSLSFWSWIALLSIIALVVYVLDSVLQSSNRVSMGEGARSGHWSSDISKRQDFIEETIRSTTEETNKRFGVVNAKFASMQATLQQIADKLKSIQIPNITKNYVVNETVSVDDLVSSLEKQVDLGQLKKELMDEILQKVPIRYGLEDKTLHYTKDFKKFVEEMAKNTALEHPVIDQEFIRQAVQAYLKDEIPSNPKTLVMDSVVDAINGKQVKVNYAEYGLGARVLGFLTNVKGGPGKGNSVADFMLLKWLFRNNFNNQEANNVLLDNDDTFKVYTTLAIRLSHTVYLTDLTVALRSPSPKTPTTTTTTGNGCRMVIYVKPKKLKYFNQLLPYKLGDVAMESDRYLKRFIPIHASRVAPGINRISLPRSLTHLQIPIRDIFLRFDAPVEVANVKGYGVTEYVGEEEFTEIGDDDVLV